MTATTKAERRTRPGSRQAPASRRRVVTVGAVVAAVLQVVAAFGLVAGIAPLGAVLTGAPAVARTQTSRTQTYGWTSQGSFPVTLAGVSCPTDQVCMAVGSNLATTTNGGLVWSQLPLPGGVSRLSSVSCVTASGCWAAGQFGSFGVMIATTDGGASWTNEILPSGIGVLTAVDCVTTKDCWALSQQGYLIASTNGGVGWTAQTVPTTVNDLTAISCTSTTACTAVGTEPNTKSGKGNQAVGLSTTDGGSTWTLTVIPPVSGPTPPATATGVSCTPNTLSGATIGSVMCLGVFDNAVFSVPDAYNVGGGGITWAVAGLSGATATTVMCADAADCWEVGTKGSINYSTDGGTTWTTQGLPALGSPDMPASPQTLAALSCPDSGHCWVVGPAKSDGGSSGFIGAGSIPTGQTTMSWTGQQTYPLSGAVNGISCTSTSDCWFVAGQSGGSQAGSVGVTSDGGQMWSALNPCLENVAGCAGTDLIESFNAITCLPVAGGSTTCWVAGVDQYGNPAIEDTQNGGQTWNVEQPPGGIGGVTAISCPTTTNCWAVTADGDIIATSDGGTAWATQTTPPKTAVSLDTIACVPTGSLFQCLAGGQGPSAGVILATVDSGADWQPQTLPRAASQITSIACPSASDCYAASGGAVLTTTDGGTDWSAEPQTSGLQGSYATITCFSTATCWAGGSGSGSGSGAGIAWTTDGGRQWFVEVTANPGPTNVTSISCPTALDCWYGGNAGTSGGGGVAFTTNAGASPPPVVSSLFPTGGSVSGGSSVTITGKYFTGAADVSFGTASVQSFTVNNDGTITVISPPAPAPGTVDVTVVTSGGISNVNPGDQFTYALPTTAPVVTAVTPSSGPPAGGTSVTISGANFANTVSVTIGGVPATNVKVSTGGTTITATTPASVNGRLGPVQAVVSTAGGGASATGPGSTYLYVAAGSYTPIVPLRICDTRAASTTNSTPCAGSTLHAGSSLTVQAAGVGSIPATDVTAVVLNVTVVAPTDSGFLAVYPSGGAVPPSSNLNFSAGETVANLVEVAVGQNGSISFHNGSMGQTDLLVDVAGYVIPPADAPGSVFTATSPMRICDTRNGNPSSLSGTAAQCNSSPLGAGAAATVQVTGVGANAVPSDATAVVLNVTMVGPQFTPPAVRQGFLTVYPSDVSRPTASNVNAWQPGEVVANRVVVALPASGSGQIDVYSSVATNLLIDVSGYFEPSGATGTNFTPTSPARIVDTRCAGSNAPSFCAAEDLQSPNIALGTLAPGASVTVQVAGLRGVPSTAAAVVANVTAVGGTAPGWLAVYPGGGTPPVVSDVNWAQGANVPNLVVALLSSGGTITIHNGSASAAVNVIVDVMGWYQ